MALLCGVALAWSPDAHSDPGKLGLGLLCICATAFCWGASTTFGRSAMLEIKTDEGNVKAVQFVKLVPRPTAVSILERAG